MALSSLLGEHSASLAVAVGCIVAVASLFLYLFNKPAFPKNAPQLTSEAWPILGSLQFFTQRWDFWQRSTAHSQSGNFSFYAGQWPVVAVSGDEGRKVFFEHKGLAFAEAYGEYQLVVVSSGAHIFLAAYGCEANAFVAALLAGQPSVKQDNSLMAEDHGGDSGFSAYFSKRLIAMLKGNQLKKGLPQLLKDCRAMLDGLAAQPDGLTEPFDSIYRMVFKFTMRTVACNEIADDPVLLARTLKLYEEVESAASNLGIMYPWLPLPSKFKRFYAGSQLYMIFKRVVDERKKTSRREDDALQYLLDQGDSVTDIITVSHLSMLNETTAMNSYREANAEPQHILISTVCARSTFRRTIE